MAFSARVLFTGICLFVPNLRENARVRMCVVLPDGSGSGSRPLSSTIVASSPLRRHTAFVTLRVRDLKGGENISEDLTGLWYLNRHQIVFRVKGGGVYCQPELGTVADISSVIPGFGFDPSIVTANPLGVIAQVLIDRGKVSGCVPIDPPLDSWSFPNTVSEEEPWSGTLSNHVALDMDNLESLSLVATPFGGGPRTIWEFSPPNGGCIEITIANLCDDNPLRWPIPEPRPVPDEDFVWYYEMLAWGEKERLAARLKGLPPPVPHPAQGGSNGRGANCVPARTALIDYDLDYHVQEC